MHVWFKLNIYPLLLTVISVAAAVMAFYIPQFRERNWIFYPLLVSAFAIMWQGMKIYGRYGEKLLLMKRLIRSGRKKFDPRCFYPYLDSPCMRHVVYFSLSELGKTEYYRIPWCNIQCIGEDTILVKLTANELNTCGCKRPKGISFFK